MEAFYLFAVGIGFCYSSSKSLGVAIVYRSRCYSGGCEHKTLRSFFFFFLTRPMFSQGICCFPVGRGRGVINDPMEPSRAIDSDGPNGEGLSSHSHRRRRRERNRQLQGNRDGRKVIYRLRLYTTQPIRLKE